MTLLIPTIAAIIATVIWYVNPKARQLKCGILIWLYWGASLMWLGDAIFEYAELKDAYFTPSAADMLNDTFLGLSVVVLALIIWVVYMLITDPLGTLKSELFLKQNENESKKDSFKRAN